MSAVCPTPQPRRGNLLFVDPDDFLIDMIEAGLRLTRSKWEILATHSPAEALEILEEHSELDAIVTELVFDRSTAAAKSFIHEVAQRWPEIPIFVMTSLDAAETREIETTEYIAKPPDMDFLMRRIDRAIRRQRESVVRGISLPTFLQILEIEKKTCTVFVSHGGRVGELFFRDGRLLDARLDGIEGAEALYAMLSMKEHSLRVVDTCEAEPRIGMSLASLLMEWSVRADHASRAEDE